MVRVQARKVNETSEEQGYCECQGMWGGDYCAECVRGYAGPDCQDQCPELCGGRGTCSNDNGTLVRRQQAGSSAREDSGGLCD